jgi:hypothetical protein
VVAIALSAVAVLTSVVSFVLTYRAGLASDRRSRMPVLVFVFEHQHGWSLRNVGNGPALNVLVAQKYVYGEKKGQWYRPVRVPPIARDQERRLLWISAASDFGLGATYEDFLGADEECRGRTYTVTCGNDLNTVVPGGRLPHWAEDAITPSWLAEHGA